LLYKYGTVAQIFFIKQKHCIEPFIFLYLLIFIYKPQKNLSLQTQFFNIASRLRICCIYSQIVVFHMYEQKVGIKGHTLFDGQLDRKTVSKAAPTPTPLLYTSGLRLHFFLMIIEWSDLQESRGDTELLDSVKNNLYLYAFNQNNQTKTEKKSQAVFFPAYSQTFCTQEILRITGNMNECFHWI
jgi:hypothetical protein